jgi:hypothetical protein
MELKKIILVIAVVVFTIDLRAQYVDNVVSPVDYVNPLMGHFPNTFFPTATCILR